MTCTTATDDVYCTTGDILAVLYGTTTTAGLADGETTNISRLASRASAWANVYLGQPLGLQVYSETVASHGRRDIMLSRTPIVRVLRFFDSTATCEATAICSSDFRIENAEAGLLSRDGGWRWTADWFESETCFNLGLTPSRLPGWESKPWLVEYVAGYRVTGSTVTCMGVSSGHDAYTTQATLPDDIVQGVAVRAVELLTNPLGAASRRVGDLAVDYRSAEGGGSGGATALLDPYRKVF